MEDRHIIWSNENLDLDDWREDLQEQYPDCSEDELYRIMCETNAEYLSDERVNLNIQLPCGVVIIGIEAVADVSAFDFLISHASAVPQTEICNNKNGLRKLNIQIDTLVRKIRTVGFAHDLIEFIIRIAGIFFF